ncbi:MAG TPA: hypothetical protein VJ954_00740 [Ignavibacteriaceae bacterium]|nr:hypothetical protein [Ignavibacteriaceae bacterium]
MLIASILNIVLLSVIVFQDIKTRTINWLLFPALAALFILKGVSTKPVNEYLTECLLNIAFVVTQLLVLFGYYYSRKNSAKHFINSAIGLGDIAFLFVITLAFSNLYFIAFYLIGLILSLLLWLIIRPFVTEKETIPLAGLLAAFMILIFLFELVHGHFEILNNYSLIGMINGL